MFHPPTAISCSVLYGSLIQSTRSQWEPGCFHLLPWTGTATPKNGWFHTQAVATWLSKECSNLGQMENAPPWSVPSWKQQASAGGVPQCCLFWVSKHSKQQRGMAPLGNFCPRWIFWGQDFLAFEVALWPRHICLFGQAPCKQPEAADGWSKWLIWPGREKGFPPLFKPV